MYKYHSIEQFRNCIKDVQFAYKEQALPVLKFTGSVKIHGTNAGVELPKNIPQSRNQVLTENNTNMGFFGFHQERKSVFEEIYKLIGVNFPVIVYGEFAGKGIQQGVGISQVDKAFYLFGIKIVTGKEDCEHYWIDISGIPSFPESNFYNLHSFKRYEVEIDFNNPQLIQNTLSELTLEVELECPVAKEQGISGIGEGIVWEHITTEGKLFAFKVKGEKHSSSKVKTLAQVDIEKLNTVSVFVESVCTLNRMEQGWFEIFTQQQKEPSMSDIGVFIKWVSQDVHKEESDTLQANGLTMKDIGYLLTKKVKSYFLEKLDETI